jgi:hypothetical protein
MEMPVISSALKKISILVCLIFEIAALYPQYGCFRTGFRESISLMS